MARFLLLVAIMAMPLLAGCGRKDQPEPPGGKSVPTNVYPKQDAMPGSPPPAPPSPGQTRK